ncbi:aminopeptidase P N-terminal domain-containing protein [Pseudofulvimonas gallinarii]|jgi:Xaa-Pro aminopeptidase|uniref:Xaa-Pro aminopeptidase n=1 Tax=Pseudofulvimonas gallinarii TaxID=634155 RepID=A0A4S3KXJ3_9GAMM|nr:aminopeptidase P N-terminal domain-containing protein [Pseudofulvimonas gallinarii]TCT00240.1 aminopeptidase P [Pseudofulvimonas gallinarii]THD14085.1 Xaa-Pro aminopeptidase [Pseudofulvimonas gallinarii]
MDMPVAEFARRRRQLMRMIGADAIAIVAAAPERVRSNDTLYPYRQNSDFHYLCGFPEPDAVLVLVPGRAAGETLLFCRERDPDRERWDGPRAGLEGAVEQYGADDAYPIGDIDDILPGLIEGRSRIHFHIGRDAEFDQRLIGWVNRVRADARRGAVPPHEISALGSLLNEMRLLKSRAELKLMREAARISVRAHQRAMAATRPGLREYHIEAELLAEFRRGDGVPAYECIVGAGANACVLHYRAGPAELRDGELLLIDAGAEFRNYAADITRTFPINGRFSPAQRALYDVVHDAQSAAIDCARVGQPYSAMHDAAVKVLTEGLIALGLIEGPLRTALKEERYRPYYMHKTGHWLGLDVHDVGDYRIDGHWRELEAGMVCTIEPGLYIAPDAPVAAKWRGIGIRIEDDVLVGREGPEVLTRALPGAAADIEALVGSG